jgi:hypothetical protein
VPTSASATYQRISPPLLQDKANYIARKCGKFLPNLLSFLSIKNIQRYFAILEKYYRREKTTVIRVIFTPES